MVRSHESERLAGSRPTVRHHANVEAVEEGRDKRLRLLKHLFLRGIAPKYVIKLERLGGRGGRLQGDCFLVDSLENLLVSMLAKDRVSGADRSNTTKHADVPVQLLKLIVDLATERALTMVLFFNICAGK